MIGYQEISAIIWMVGLVMFILCLMTNPPVLIIVLIFGGIIFMFFATLIPNYVISINQLQPLINKIRPENHVIWIRITKNKLLTFQIVKKGVYGQTKGIVHKHKSDVIDKGDFPISTINGNRAILVYDMSSNNVNPEHVVAWKKLFKKYGVTSAKDAYLRSKGKYAKQQ